MKYLIILGDGMADQPIQSLRGLTPLQAAATPNMDRLASKGRSGMLATIPEGFSPSSDVANLSVLGYDVASVYEGRGPLEAASMGIEVGKKEMAMRCNLITVEDGKIKNHSAGHISTPEAAGIIKTLQDKLGGDKTTVGQLRADFFPGVSYRCLLKVHNGDKNIICIPPHDAAGRPFRDELIAPLGEEGKATADFLNEIIYRSQDILERHPVNIKRQAEGLEPANSAWFWSPGYRPDMKTLREKYGIGSGTVISAVDLIKGIGKYAGLKIVEVEGATGLYDTNYEGKAEAAIEALKIDDFVFLHIEASDEAGHEGDERLKARTIESLDRRVVGPLIEEFSQWSEPVRIALLPDHPTPCALRTHTADPVPFVIFDPGGTPDGVECYDEFAAREGSYGLLRGGEFMREFLN